MAASIREQAVSALLAKLQAITGITGLKVERNRDAEVTALPTVLLQDGEGEDTLLTWLSGAELRQMTFDIQGFAAPSDLDALRSAVLLKIYEDHTLGGLSVDVMVESETAGLDQVGGHKKAAAFALSVALQYATQPGDPLTGSGI